MFESFISVVLAVLENTSSDIVEKPIFDTRSENVTVLAGETATLPCQVDNLGKDYKVDILLSHAYYKVHVYILLSHAYHDIALITV